MASGTEKREDQRCSAKLATGSLVQLTKMQSYRMSENYRSESIQTKGIPVTQPGATMYRRSMPVAAVAKARRAAYHSHTVVVEQRDDCNMVRLKVPGFALAISTGDPAFRLEMSRPKRTMV